MILPFTTRVAGIFLVVGAIAIVTQRKAAFRGARSTIVTNGTLLCTVLVVDIT